MRLIAGNFLLAAVLVQFPPCSNPSDDSQIFRPTDVNAASFVSSGRRRSGRARLPAAASPDLGVRSRPHPQTLPASNRLEAASGPVRSLIGVHAEMLKKQNGSQSPPLKKGDLGGCQDSYKIPPIPPLVNGGMLGGFRIRTY